MNFMQYKLENYIYQNYIYPKNWLEKYPDELYRKFSDLVVKTTEKNVDITLEEFKQLIVELYDILKLKMSTEDFYKVTEHYVVSLLADGVANKKITLSWCLDQIWYLTTYYDKKVTEKYREDIPFIQNRLYKKFKIQEKFTEKTKRRIRTQLMCKKR